MNTFPLVFPFLLVTSLVQLIWSSRFEGRARVFPPLLWLVLGVVIALPPIWRGERPSAAWWFAVLFLVGLAVHGAIYALRGHMAGVAPLVSRDTRWPGTYRAWQTRRRLDRFLRRPSRPPSPPTESGDALPVLAEAAVRAGGGDAAAAVGVLDATLDAQVLRDGVLGLALYHRTVYAAVASLDGAALDTARAHSDLALARTLLPDPRLGWLADAALAAAEGGRWSGPASAKAVTRFARGPWEAGLAALLLAGDDGESHAQVAERYPWLAGLARRAAGTPTAP